MTVTEAQAALETAARRVDAEELCSCPILETGKVSPRCAMLELANALAALDAARKEEADAKCVECHGRGVHDNVEPHNYGLFTLRQCEACHGTGKRGKERTHGRE